MARPQSSTVTRRRVFYIPGYDPIHPRRYRELYRKESAAQAEISDYQIQLSPRKGARYGWQVDAEIEDHKTSAEIEVLVWSDIVRDSMETNIPGTYLQLIRTAWTYISSGTLRRLMWLRKGPIIAALYPVGMLIGQLLLALLLGWAAKALIGTLSGYPAMGWIAALPVFVLVMRWFRAKDNKLFAYYLCMTTPIPPNPRAPIRPSLKPAWPSSPPPSPRP